MPPCEYQDSGELILQAGTSGSPCKHRKCASCKRYYRPAWGKSGCCECNPCFPADAKLSVESGKLITMSELEIGDKIQTGRKMFKMFKMKNKPLC